MQKITIVILIVGLGLLLANLFWTAIISQNLSELLEITRESFGVKTEFTRIVEELKDSQIVEKFIFVTRGGITDIKNLNLGLEYKGSILRIPVDTDAQIVEQTSKEAIPEMILFEDIRVGDEVSCFVEMREDGSWSAYRVNIFKRKSSE